VLWVNKAFEKHFLQAKTLNKQALGSQSSNLLKITKQFRNGKYFKNQVTSGFIEHSYF